MCRFVVYLGPPITLGSLLTEPTHSLIHQSFRAQERVEPLNGDGFGVAWYAPQLSDRPARFRSITPAWSNQSLQDLARVTESGCILAHVRAATPGLAVIETNCHPFTHRHFAFMHNGKIAEFARIKRALQGKLSDAAFDAIQGSTDSEHVFALLLDALGDQHDLPAALRQAIRQVVALTATAGVTGVTELNLAVTNGRRVVVSRYTTDPDGAAPSLYVHRGQRYVCEEGICHMVEPDTDGGAVLVASEAISEDPGWQPVPANHLVIVDEDRSVEIVEV